ncbi:MAG TPA: site-2 protease family protein [Methanobacteriaceae archaeon]|nr:site-2 protease family protein [Methanobacteriaceae archaeon]
MVKFTAHEIRDIIISMLVIAGVFAYVLRYSPIFDNIAFNDILSRIVIALVAVGFAFVLHELSHKFVAVHYGFYAEYRMWAQGLILAIVTAYFGFVFAAPGAVYIHGDYISREQNGKISIVGPLTNIGLAVLFFILLPLVSFSPILSAIFGLGFIVNSFLALFNLIPISILDGAKVFKWNPIIWALTAGFAFLMVIYPYVANLIT